MAGIDIGYLGGEEWCCGRPADWDGQPEIQEQMARHNIKAMKEAGAKKIIFACPGCYLTFRDEYPQMVGTLPFETLHITEYLLQFVKSGKLKFKKSAAKITYHDPCHLGRFAGVFKQPRELLTRVPGVELVEMERHGRFSYCCGGSSDFSEWVASQRLEEAKKAANTIVTACPRCVQNLSIAARKDKGGMAVYSITTYLTNNLEK
jgi:Fe-S oxidoreductase